MLVSTNRLLCLLASLTLCACSEESADGSGGSSGSGAQGAGASGSGASTGSGGATASTGGGGEPTGGAATGGSGAQQNQGFPDAWIDGTDCGSEPDVMVWQYDPDTFILRQSLCTNFEGPFLYLFFGEDKALLQDTGTGDADVQEAVAGIVEEWLAANGKASIELVVTHSHSHGDHVGGDGQFAGQPNTTVVGTSVSAVASFFGITDWPNQIAQYDLGGRVLDIVPIPGHQAAHVAVYDRAQDLLLTGDTLYPGRLYIDDWADYRLSIPRMVDFVDAGNPVTWVLGTHIEMTTTPGDDYPFSADQHPNEHQLQLDYSVLLELEQAVEAMGNSPQIDVHDDFIVYPL